MTGIERNYALLGLQVYHFFVGFLEDEMVRKAFLVFALAMTLTTALSGATKHVFQTGKLISVTSDERFVEGTSYQWAIFRVQIGDLTYTARGERIRRHSGDIGQGLVIGDTVQVVVDGENLMLLKPDGKELKAKIIKRERAQ